MLEEGHHVRITVRLFGRQLGLLDVAKRQLEFFEKQLNDVAKVTLPPGLKGRQLSATFMPLPAVTERARSALRKKDERRDPEES